MKDNPPVFAVHQIKSKHVQLNATHTRIAVGLESGEERVLQLKHSSLLELHSLLSLLAAKLVEDGLVSVPPSMTDPFPLLAERFVLGVDYVGHHVVLRFDGGLGDSKTIMLNTSLAHDLCSEVPKALAEVNDHRALNKN